MISKTHCGDIRVLFQKFWWVCYGIFLITTAPLFAQPANAQVTASPTEASQTVLATPPNLETLRTLAEQGHPVAQFNLGVMHDFGQGGAVQDHKIAFGWYSRAAAQGHAGAQFNLGGLYYEGLGVEKNLVRSVMWFTLAGMAGFSGAAKNRTAVSSLLSPAQVAQAQALVRACQQSGFKQCA
jgi:hypothetical protein